MCFSAVEKMNFKPCMKALEQGMEVYYKNVSGHGFSLAS